MTIPTIDRAQARLIVIADLAEIALRHEAKALELRQTIATLERELGGQGDASPGEKIIEGMQEALAVARGEEEPARVHTVSSEPQPSPAAQTEPPSTEGINEPVVEVADGANTGGDDEVAQHHDTDIEKTGCGPVEGRHGADREALGSAVESGAPSISPDPVTLTDTIAPTEPTKKERVRRCHEEHPDWPAKLIAEHLGLSYGSASGHAASLGIKLPTVAEYEAAQRAKTTEALKAPAPAEPPSAPTAGPVIEPKPYHLTHRPVLKAKAGTKFYLRDRATGHYLHCSVTLNKSGTPLLTTEKVYAWQGTEAHMLAVRKKMPATIDFHEQVVEKEPVRA